jgi:hypothetical protein
VNGKPLGGFADRVQYPTGNTLLNAARDKEGSKD